MQNQPPIARSKKPPHITICHPSLSVTRHHLSTVTIMLLFPNAKINLGLNVTSRRRDGYHEIITLMVPIESHDILEIVPAADGIDSLCCSGRSVECPMEKNLVYKALIAMRKRYDVPAVRMYLDKQTPDGAGLGGGSADAACTLMGLNELFGLGASKQDLAEIASGIGADCPFFIYNRPMLCTGIGTTFSPVELDLPEPLYIVVVKPSVSVPTREAYASLIPKLPEHDIAQVVKLPMDQWRGKLVNDFEPTVFSRYPEVGEIKQKLYDMGAVYASMSGSGSALFGLFDRDLSADEIKPLGRMGCYLYRKF